MLNNELKKYKKNVKKINKLEDKITRLTNEELKNKTVEFKEKLKNGATKDSILVEAYAVVREMSKRILGMRHYDVQLIGGMVLHDGKVAEMKTGEGKTLVATLPTYINALEGEGVHVVTTNEYLAQRDKELNEPLFNEIGDTMSMISEIINIWSLPLSRIFPRIVTPILMLHIIANVHFQIIFLQGLLQHN